MKSGESAIVVKQSGGTNGEKWGNVFFTADWTLHIDMTEQQHELAMKRLGIHSGDVLLSGIIRRLMPDKIFFMSWRSAPGEDRGEITNAESLELYRMIKVEVEKVIA